jgi:hypothetical protein
MSKREYPPGDEAVCASRSKAARLPLPHKIPLFFKRKAAVIASIVARADSFLPDLSFDLH